MGKLRQTALVIGEGITEFYYFNSLKDVIRGVQIQPAYPKHSTSLRELGEMIDEGIDCGYDRIFCVVDMDNKQNDKERRKYSGLKAKYSKPIVKPKKGIHCEVCFIETHLCTELFFFYYFEYTSKCYQNQQELIADLREHCKYRKEEAFFKRCHGLHAHLEKAGGCLASAVANADRSCREREQTGRDFTYSQLGEMIKSLMKM